MSMNAILPSLHAVLAQPTPETLWQLRADLLAGDVPASSPAIHTCASFYHFLTQLAANAASHQYSHFASLLDMGAVGSVAIQNLLEDERTSEWWQRFLVGGVSEGLMALAARQYVKAWEEELRATYQTAAWTLREALWTLSSQMQPDVDSAHRLRLIDDLLRPLRQPKVSGAAKAALIVRLFQLLLLLQLALYLDET